MSGTQANGQRIIEKLKSEIKVLDALLDSLRVSEVTEQLSSETPSDCDEDDSWEEEDIRVDQGITSVGDLRERLAGDRVVVTEKASRYGATAAGVVTETAYRTSQLNLGAEVTDVLGDVVGKAGNAGAVLGSVNNAAKFILADESDPEVMLKKAKGPSRAEKVQNGLQVTQAVTSAVRGTATTIGNLKGVGEGAVNVLGEVAGVAGQVVGGIGAAKGAVNVVDGVSEAASATVSKGEMRKEIIEHEASIAVKRWMGDATDSGEAGEHAKMQEKYEDLMERAGQRHLIEQQITHQKEGAFKATTGALDVATGVATATGVGTAVGAATALTSLGLKGAKWAGGNGVQKARDLKAESAADLLAREAGAKWIDQTLEEHESENLHLSRSEKKKLKKHHKQRALHKKSLRGDKMGVMNSMRDATTVNTEASKENQRLNRLNTANLVLRSKGKKQIKYLKALGINKSTWEKMQAADEAFEYKEGDGDKILEMLIAGQVNI
jgi:hypothetical protein